MIVHSISKTSKPATPSQLTPPMDPPPLPPLPTLAASTTPTAAAAAIPSAATSMHLNYPDSVDSSPRSYDEPLPPVPGAKLRFMCSYGGHIMPRPHDKVLCYVGGETRLVVVDRHSSLLVLCTRLSRTLLNGCPFTLKYQLPNEDLDSLVTVTTDEDLENMIEEYDRITVPSTASSPRIRLFLFFNKPETAASMGALLADPKSETWFVDALNGSMLIPRGLSDSATMDCLLNPDSDDLEAHVEGGAEGENKEMKNDAAAIHDVQHSMSDSPMVETASSFGSSSSTPTMANLPPIRVQVEEGGLAKMQDHGVGIEEQFTQISFAAANMHKQGDGFRVAVPLLPHPATVAVAMTAAPVATINPADGSSETLNQILSDDERSDQEVPTGCRKPPLPLQPVQHKAGGAYNLPSPDSFASDASASSFSKPMYHNEQVHAVSSPNNNINASMSSSQIQIQQVQDPGHGLPPHLDQQQHQQQQQKFVHPSMHYIPHPATGTVPMPSYYPVYAPPPQQHHPYPVDQQYPVYVLPVAAQPQPYMTMQSNIHDASVVASSHPLTSPNPSVVTSSAAHKDAIPPIYPAKVAPATGKAEMAATMCRAAATPAPQMVQVPSNQIQQQYVGLPQMHHPSQSIAVAPATAANYGYEYANSTHDQMYYTRHQATPLPSLYQTLTQAAAAAALADVSNQMPADNTKQQ